MADFGGLNANQLMTGASALNSDPSKYVNNQDVEMQWAVKAYHHAETYYNLLCSVDTNILKLTKKDDEIYAHFRKMFPDFNVKMVKEEELKTPEAKAKWRDFINVYEKEVEDYNFGTLMRMDAAGDVSNDNTILVVRVQFLAIEIARNKEGVNSIVKAKKLEGL